MVLYQRFADDHKQRRGNALSGNVRHHDGKVAFVHHKEIVEIASHLLCGIHGGENIKLLPVGKGGENTRQHIRLNTRRNGQLRVDTFLFGGDNGEVFGVSCDIRFHLFDCPRENPDLVLLPDINGLS